VVTFHNFYLDAFAIRQASVQQRIFYQKVLSRYVDRAVQRADVVTAVSAFTAGLVEKHLGVAPVVIRNGVDTETFKPSAEGRPDGKLRVLFAGNLSRRKGKEVVKALAAELQDVCDFICASGLRKGGKSRAVGGIHYLGRVLQRDMPGVYQASDVLLLPTLREGMSLATLEAMASGLPVVTTDLSSQPELIDHGRGGYTLDFRDRAGFARCLRTLAAEPALRRDMGDYNRAKVVEGFTLERMVAGYRQVFECLER
jgi:glycosyltransferase involved in cell wall biosynthesis